MLMLLLGILSGMLLKDVLLSFLSHLHDLVVGLKNDLVAIKDKILILLRIKSAPVETSVSSTPSV